VRQAQTSRSGNKGMSASTIIKRDRNVILILHQFVQTTGGDARVTGMCQSLKRVVKTDINWITGKKMFFATYQRLLDMQSARRGISRIYSVY
jgi:hypothetical protein